MRGGRKVDASRFAMSPRADIARSAFDVFHTHKTTFDAGFLVPIYVEEVLPGDSFKVDMTAFARLATPIVPIMDNIYLDSWFFFVPNRLTWSNWERFMGEQLTVTDTTEFLTPQIPWTASPPTSLQDYMGITWGGAFAAAISVCALPFRAYNLIWNEWFRDQDFQNPVVVDLDDGPDAPGDYVLLRRNKRHDYFTSARPWPQKPVNISEFYSNSGPYIPGGRMLLPQSGAPVTGIGIVPGTVPVGPASIANTGGRITSNANVFQTGAFHDFQMKATAAGYPDVRVLINDIRTAEAVQIMMERNSRGGTRYAELVRRHFGVSSPDARLQRPELLGVGRSMVNINPVAQTSATALDGSTTALGELAGVGTVVARHGFSQSFTEHGYVLGLVNVRADLSYQQGINRMWFRRSQYDFFFPGLAHLGEQAILSRELFATGAAADGDVFGYQERWSEYKYKPSRISGAFRSTIADPLDMWHLSQEFAVRPVLNPGFLQEDPPMARVLTVDPTYGAQFYLDSAFQCRYVRPMPMFSIPGVGVRF